MPLIGRQTDERQTDRQTCKLTCRHTETQKEEINTFEIWRKSHTDSSIISTLDCNDYHLSSHPSTHSSFDRYTPPPFSPIHPSIYPSFLLFIIPFFCVFDIPCINLSFPRSINSSFYSYFLPSIYPSILLSNLVFVISTPPSLYPRSRVPPLLSSVPFSVFAPTRPSGCSNRKVWKCYLLWSHAAGLPWAEQRIELPRGNIPSCNAPGRSNACRDSRCCDKQTLLKKRSLCWLQAKIRLDRSVIAVVDSQITIISDIYPVVSIQSLGVSDCRSYIRLANLVYY